MRHSSIDSILQNYSILISALEEIEQGHDQYMQPKQVVCFPECLALIHCLA